MSIKEFKIYEIMDILRLVCSKIFFKFYDQWVNFFLKWPTKFFYLFVTLFNCGIFETWSFNICGLIGSCTSFDLVCIFIISFSKRNCFLVAVKYFLVHFAIFSALL
jgi:hypothetical protein